MITEKKYRNKNNKKKTRLNGLLRCQNRKGTGTRLGWYLS